ncbi:MAG: DUF4249 domain-containing protein [Bacteroidales bacterium]|jgi:hypothetical protein|nr:DUF4249 domain-containing protein [Bacteroidales bacterium]
MIRLSAIILMFYILSLAEGCTIEFDPEIRTDEELLVVEGMITDQNSVNRIKLSLSTRIGKPVGTNKVTGAVVTITDENGIVTTLRESPAGTYVTDSTVFRGRTGGRYALNVKVNGKSYETGFVEMLPVPPINSLYYEKVVITAARDSNDIDEGARIYVDSYDPSGKCLFFRWDYVETWEYQIPYNVVNKICWVTERSDEILVKNTSLYSQAKVSKFPVLFVSNKSDRLKETYSILVRQYSVSEEEYNFWEKIRNVSQNVGNLYDVTPMSIQGNIRCCDDPEETVLGYFSVSAVTEKRLFIHDTFLGLPVFVTYCATDTLQGVLPDTGLNSDYWVIEDFSDEIPPFWVITTFKECADCSTRGTKVRPPFWEEF